MQKEPFESNANIEREGDEQLRDERWVAAAKKSVKNSRIKKVGKFW